MVVVGVVVVVGDVVAVVEVGVVVTDVVAHPNSFRPRASMAVFNRRTSVLQASALGNKN